MAESSTTGKRVRRSTKTSERLQRARERQNEQLAEQKAREKRVRDAMRAFIDADEQRAEVEEAGQAKVADLERKIEEVNAETAAKVAGVRASQERSVWEMSQAGRTAEQIAELLELSVKETRRLLTAGRKAAKGDDSGSAGTGATVSTGVSSGSEGTSVDHERDAAAEEGEAGQEAGPVVQGADGGHQRQGDGAANGERHSSAVEPGSEPVAGEWPRGGADDGTADGQPGNPGQPHWRERGASDNGDQPGGGRSEVHAYSGGSDELGELHDRPGLHS